MPNRLINVSQLGQPAGHYSHAVEVNRADKLYFISGILPVTSAAQPLTNAPFMEQAQQVFDHLDQILLTCQAKKKDLVQIRVYLSHIDYWTVFNQLYSQWIGEHKPARCVVPVPALHHDLSLEIEAVVSVSQ